MTDPTLEQLRQQITEIDRSIIEAFNRRLAIVAQIKRHKDEHEIAFVDPDREAAMLAHQTSENQGPLSDEGLRTLYAELLALTKRELGSH
jgi:chorismate mutase/prephenate dehydratase